MVRHAFVFQEIQAETMMKVWSIATNKYSHKNTSFIGSQKISAQYGLQQIIKKLQY